jgi:hypothetical protein
LRLHARSVSAAAPGHRHAAPLVRRGHAARYAAGRHPVGMGELRRVPRRHRAGRNRRQRRVVHRPLGHPAARHGRGLPRARGDGERACGDGPAGA